MSRAESEAYPRKRSLRDQLAGSVGAKVFMYGVIPALGIVGLFVFDALGFDLRGHFGGKTREALFITGFVVVGILAGVICLGLTAYFVIKEVMRWRQDPPPES
jgi:hypothetical protein